MAAVKPRRAVLLFQHRPVPHLRWVDAHLLGLARHLRRAGLLPTVAIACDDADPPDNRWSDEAHRLGWAVRQSPAAIDHVPDGRDGGTPCRWLEYIVDGVPVDLRVSPSGLESPAATHAGTGPEAAFRAALDRCSPATVLFADRWPTACLVDACRSRGIASALLYRGIDHSPAERQPPLDLVLATSDAAAAYYHEVYGHRPQVVEPAIDPAGVPRAERDPRHLLFVDPTPENGAYLFARVADEVGRLRPDIPMLVVEAEGTEADLANCGLDLTTRGNLSIMSPTRTPQRYWRLARVCVAPTLGRFDPPSTVLRAISNEVPTVCSDRVHQPTPAGVKLVVLPPPVDLTTVTKRLPDADEVIDWVQAVIRLWDESVTDLSAEKRPASPDAGDGPGRIVPALAAVIPGPPPRPVMPPGRAKAVALVPYLGAIEDACEEGLRALEFEGIRVIRRGGQSAIDVARNAMCSEVLHDGFESILFIDSDIGFNVVDALRLFARPEPVVSGVYAKKGGRAIASVFRDNVAEVIFGPERGGLYPLKHAATGFLRIRSGVLRRMIAELDLPICNIRWNRGFWPFFMPMIVADGDHRHYLAEDWAFSRRLSQIGICPLADTTIRLWHVGKHQFGWEDAGLDPPRHGTFHLKLKG